MRILGSGTLQGFGFGVNSFRIQRFRGWGPLQFVDLIFQNHDFGSGLAVWDLGFEV